jgi:hypothetical protein
MLEQWNGGMMGFKKTEFKAHNFAFFSCSDFHIQYSNIPSFHVAYKRKWP